METHEGVPTDPAVTSRWESLVDADPLATVFSTPDYLRLWQGTLGVRASVRVHELLDGDELVGVVPVALHREGTPTGPIEVVRFAGGSDVTDYLGPIAAPAHRAAVAAAYAARLAEDADWDEFVAGGLVEDSEWPQAWRDACEAAGLRHLETVDEDVCPRVDLDGGYAGFLDRLGGKQRHELRRKARKLARDAGDVQLVEVAQADLPAALERFFEMNVDLGDDKGRFFANDDMRAWFLALAEELGPSGVFRLHELHVGGMPGAACVSLVRGGEWGLYNSAFDSTLAMLAPGMVIVGELVELAAEEGCHVFDLLRGDEEYKYRFGPVDRRLLTSTFERA